MIKIGEYNPFKMLGPWIGLGIGVLVVLCIANGVIPVPGNSGDSIPISFSRSYVHGARSAVDCSGMHEV